MKITKLLALLTFTLVLSDCGKDKPAAITDRQLTEVTHILSAAENKFIELGSKVPGDPKKAIEQTKVWLRNQSTVASAESVDSIYINIILKSGLQREYGCADLRSGIFPILQVRRDAEDFRSAR